jgi:chromatin segregation and condensation protein Rec8/ScpA/Scc1 (kleisin family)
MILTALSARFGPPVPKRRKRPNLSDARSWLSHLAAAAGIDFERMSLAEAADRAVSQLEQQRDADLPLRPETVRLAALLVRIEGEMAVAGASSAEAFIERAYALDRARWLAGRHAAGQRVWMRPEIPVPELEPEPEPEPEPGVTLYDLIRTYESLMEYVKQRQAARSQ